MCCGNVRFERRIYVQLPSLDLHHHTVLTKVVYGNIFKNLTLGLVIISCTHLSYSCSYVIKVFWLVLQGGESYISSVTTVICGTVIQKGLPKWDITLHSVEVLLLLFFKPLKSEFVISMFCEWL